MKFEYDKDADAAYVYLKYPIKDGEVKSTVEQGNNIVLDYDKNKKLIGVEILEASKIMDKEVLLKAN